MYLAVTNVPYNVSWYAHALNCTHQLVFESALFSGAAHVEHVDKMSELFTCEIVCLPKTCL
jgi:hypothetical protein